MFQTQWGWKSLIPEKSLLTPETIYDLASLTKPLVTAFLLVYLAEKEPLSLDSPVKKFLPQVVNAGEITLLQLLTHTSGLPAWYPLYLFPQEYLQTIAKIELESRPGAAVNYSCVGYILLYFIVQKISGIPFSTLARQVIFEPLGLKNTFLDVPEAKKNLAAPTEAGNHFEKAMALEWVQKQKSHNKEYLEYVHRFNWRQHLLQGETHDVNSFHLGGTAGNAGLFSTTSDLFLWCREFFPETASLLNPSSLKLFRTNYTPFKKSHRTIGFKRKSSFITSGGRALSRKAIGHNGFTGTSIWLDLDRGLTVISLSNRIHPKVKSCNFDRIRRKINRLLIKTSLSK